MLTKTLFAVSSALFAVFATVDAAVAPTYPSPGTTWVAGKEYEILWNDDGKSPAWKKFKIDFMTGDNLNQKVLTNVATDLDPAAKSFKWKAPEVEPYSAIYFFMFTGDSGEASWTTRFAITGADGQQVEPPNKTQPDGEDIPWGVGSLKSGNTNATNSDPASSPAPASSSVPSTAAPLTAATAASSSAASSSAPVSSAAEKTPDVSSNQPVNQAKQDDTSAKSSPSNSATTDAAHDSAAGYVKPALGLVAAAALTSLII
ncbi:uncharacterized protein BYT42DRAFT_557082 [Radiomyces spectabilis]|uniref:uncharacterized protein n=1 Tax=Radiomyces spectabilis TaxID=64574 RepID=UPI002220E787|nr:uncharacterized protein BYT42DRAFT_557082 [Radiomyces spectabilis]KAI8391502.1 hypothetical protein BYT42DRAFT_557082 [Radiomyces spectabilis]